MALVLKEEKEKKSKLLGVVPTLAQTPKVRIDPNSFMNSFGENLNQVCGEKCTPGSCASLPTKELPALNPVRKNLVKSLKNLV